MQKSTLLKVLIAVVAVGAIAVFGGSYLLKQGLEEYRDKSRDALATLNASTNLTKCKYELHMGAADQLEVLYAIGGVPRESLGQAVEEGIEHNCACLVDLAGDADFEPFLGDEANKPALERCAEESAQAVFSKFAVTEEEADEETDDEETDDEAIEE